MKNPAPLPKPGSIRIHPCDDYCVGCGYHEVYINCCTYFLDTGKRRGCLGGTGCKRRIDRKLLKEQQKPKPKKKRRTKPSAGMRTTPREDALRMAYYQQGLSDYAIADKVGVSPQTIRAWRRVRNLPANHQITRRNDTNEQTPGS